jgi:predicted SAM-dependent methyltransferase
MYTSETDKIRERVLPYLNGFVIDIGYGGHKIVPHAYTIDGRDLPELDFKTDNLYTLPEQLHGKIPLADAVFSSHCLEHLADDYGALMSWTKLIKKGGYLILYLPDGSKYSNIGNPEHMRDYNYDNFMFWFDRVFCGEGKDFRGNNFPAIYEMVESSKDPDFENDMYSFYLVARKL